MKTDKVSAKKENKASLLKAARVSGRILGIVVAAGVALIAVTDKVMKAATGNDEEKTDEPKPETTGNEDVDGSEEFYINR